MLLDPTWRILRPLLFRLDPERAHRLTISTLHRAPRLATTVLRTLAGPVPPGLSRRLGPLTIPAPVGLAAGLDKDGEAPTVWPALGFGFVELGTVTALPQPGNPRPRLFRLPAERALINRMGFNNEGSAALARRLQRLRDRGDWPDVPVGANVGKSKVTPLDDRAVADDYRTSVTRLRDVVDYLAINVSSPNTPGLRTLQAVAPLRRLVGSVLSAAGDRPVFVKLAPDFEPEELAEVVEGIIAEGATGIIATNTTTSRPGTTGRLGEEGGLSGAPLWPLARSRIQTVLDTAAGRVPVVGVGGIHRVDQVAELLDAGCAAVQLYTGLIYEGPGLVRRLHHGLASGGGA
ncbi:MAG: quinone-dependent dihydroorotate dehydrogenase [Deltaproteobacteria bacterium]|nr:MAG: quinone-dependent dihydroorotate dehydrogenase [Deltaproteobacteria bacterium]